MSEIELREERPEDAEAIHDVTAAAFKGAAFSDGTEPGIPAALRSDGALALSLVAVRNDDVIGHVAFSPALIGDDTGWLAVGPLSVHPDAQRLGVGTMLMEDGLTRARALGAEGCVLIGDPAYYRRFGFASYDGLRYGSVPSANVMAMPFGRKRLHGAIRFHPAFGEH